MNVVGIPRKVDALGRIVLPGELRRIYGIIEGTYLEIIPVEEGFLIKRKIEKTIFENLK